MKFDTLTRRAAAAGAASALVAGALVAATGTAAQAAEVDNTYTCEGTTAFPVTMTGGSATLDGLPGAPAGWDVAAGLLQDLSLTFTVPDAVLAQMAALNIDRMAVPDFAATFGATEVGVDGVEGAVADMVDNGNGTHSFSVVGINRAFEVPAAGTHDVVSPAAFTIDAYQAGGTDPVISVPCAIASNDTPGVWREDLTVTKNDSTTTARAKDATIKKGETARIVVKVAAPNETPSGKVVLKKGAKTLAKGTLDATGKVVLKAKKGLTVGKNKLTVKYAGDGYTNKSNAKLVVKVRR